MKRTKFNTETVKSQRGNIYKTHDAIVEGRWAELDYKKLRLEVSARNWNILLGLVEKSLPGINTVAYSYGCIVEGLSYAKTGTEDDSWDADTALQVTFKMVPFNKKLRFLTPRGYDSSGASMNNKKLKEKAAKIQKVFIDNVGWNTQVNEYSLEGYEGDSGKHENRVLVSMWVRSIRIQPS